MRRAPKPFVLFAVAAGPELGFGHLVRAGRLADELGVRRELVLHGPEDARDVALAFGWTVHETSDAIAALEPDLVIVDDPSEVRTERWVARARRAEIAVVVIEDGRALSREATLAVDGNVAARPLNSPSRLSGPAFALIDPRLARARGNRPHRRTRVFIALGGGVHARRFGAALAEAICQLVPGTHVDVAAGFVTKADRPALPPGCRWITAPNGLTRQLSQAAVSVVAGGVTLHEACAVGCPTVGIAVVPAQRRAIRAAAAVSAVVDAGALDRQTAVDRAAAAVADLLANPTHARFLAARAARLVDGHGLARVARRIRGLFEREALEGWRDAA
jgi:spore coat polysaccharide biosynthesis predicted glycosyltransferase SpsG